MRGVLLLLLTAGLLQAEPIRVIFDTDMGNDVDDALALALLHAFEARGECRLLAVTVSKDNLLAGRFVDLLNTFYGRGDVPVGMVRQGPTPGDGKYLRQLVEATDNGQPRYPHARRTPEQLPDAVTLLRQVLAGQPDQSVVLIQVGFSTNLARLLDSTPDADSPLDGTQLVAKKVRLLSAMAAAFTPKLLAGNKKEYNIVRDIPAAQRVFHTWPSPIVLSGFEVGLAIQHPGRSMREDYHWISPHPLVEAYSYYRGLNLDQPTFDLTSVLYAVRPDRGYFTCSKPGRLQVEDDGITRFIPDPAGRLRYLSVTPEQIARVREIQAALASQPRHPPNPPR